MREKSRSTANDREFLARLRTAMETKKVSQVTLSRRLGCDESTVSGWFTRSARPRGTILAKIPEALGVSYMWLLGGKGTMEVPADTHVERRAQLRRAEQAGALYVITQLEGHIAEMRKELGHPG